MTAEANAEQRDHLMQATCVRALAHKDQWQPGMHLTCWIFRVAQNLWFGQNRAEKFRGKPVEMEMADYLVGSEERAVTERRHVLADLLRGPRPALTGALGVDRFGVRLRPHLRRSRRNPEPTRRDGDAQTGPGSARALRCG